MNAIAPALAADRPLCIAILAMGGQGGGVLADWIVALAERAGWVAQSTSVPGVAQRTGATIYYIEVIGSRPGLLPVLALSPAPGEVDVVLAAEWMEGGRAMLRGFVAPDRTTLIASTHRAFAVGEKEVPGDGIADPAVVSAATSVAARRTIAFDMAAVAAANGSVISAAMFGALAGSGALPFQREDFEQTVRGGGVGVGPSLLAFSAAFERAARQDRPERPDRVPAKITPPLPGATGVAALDALLERIRREIPAPAQGMAYAGVQRLTDWQDTAYAGVYLDRLSTLGTDDPAVLTEAARQLAVALAYDDLFRVADVKTRSSRFARVRGEMGAPDGQILNTTEFMHPRLAELCGALPAQLGAWLEGRPKLFAWLDRRVSRGRRVRTGTIRWFLPLFVLASLRKSRLGTLRHRQEMAHIETWLAAVREAIAVGPALGIEVLKCRRLVKGYSDTHARGMSKFDRVLAAVPCLALRADGADWVRRLRDAALADEDGVALDGGLRTVASFVKG